MQQRQQHQKGTKFHTQKTSLLLHTVDLSTALVKVDIKVINANLIQNQCLQCVPLPLTHAEIPRLRDATELNNDGMIKLGCVTVTTSTTKHNRIYQLLPKDNQRRLQFLFA